MKNCIGCRKEKAEDAFEPHRKRCKACRNLRRREYGTRSGKGLRRQRLNYLYGISLERYDAMLVEQGGVCKVCGHADNGRWATLAVDHNHTTGRVRGLLCAKCNKGLGQFNDDVVLIRKAVTYLEGSL